MFPSNDDRFPGIVDYYSADDQDYRLRAQRITVNELRRRTWTGSLKQKSYDRRL